MALLFGSLQVGLAADISHTNGVIRFAGSEFVLSFSDTNGSMLSVAPSSGTGTVFTRGELGLWSASFKEGGRVK